MTRDVFLLSNAYWPSIGGIENSLRHLAEEAQAAGDRVTIIVSDIGCKQPIRSCEADVVDGVDVIRYPLRPLKSLLFSPFNIIWSNFLLYNLLHKQRKKFPNATVVARFHFAAFLASCVGFKCVRYLVPSVFSEQVACESKSNETWLSRSRTKLKTLLHSGVQRRALASCKVFVFSETMKQQCQNLLGNIRSDFFVVKPGVDTKRFYPVNVAQRNEIKLDLNLPLDLPLVLFVGRFVKAKGVESLIEAVARVQGPCHLILIGSGEELNNYKQRIEALKLSSRVTILPPLRGVESYYRCADMFVMCSSYEPLGQTILEAFASGLPLIAYKKSESVNTATEELGMDDYISYAEFHSEAALAEAIEKQIQANKTINREQISEAATKFSWQKLYSELVD